VFAKLNEGKAEDPIEPVLTIDNIYPGTIRINRKNPINPINIRYLLSITMPIGTIAIKMNKIKRIGNLAMFLKGYLKEFKMIFPTSMLPAHLKMKTGFFS
jgi:hypothetical protein